MLTMEDCIGLSDLDRDEVTEIARHERLPYMTALEKGAALLNEPYGDAAVRQMVWDNLCHATRQNADARVIELTALYRSTCQRHPGLCDRRRSPVRPAHPVWH